MSRERGLGTNLVNNMASSVETKDQAISDESGEDSDEEVIFLTYLSPFLQDDSNSLWFLVFHLPLASKGIYFW